MSASSSDLAEVEGAPGRPAPSRWWIALAVVLIYGASVGHGYTLDDAPAVLRHPAVVGEVPWWEVFVREYWGERLDSVDWSSSYRPLTSLTFALEHRITAHPWLHHAVNVALYGTLCLMVTRVAARFTSERIAWWAGLGFAVLPVHVENVASIVGRADVLASLCGVGAFALLVPARWLSSRASGASTPPMTHVAAGCALYVMGMLCKESVALLPAVVAGWWVVTMLASQRDEAVPAPGFASPVALIVTGALYLTVRQGVLPVGLPDSFIGADNLLMEVSAPERLWRSLAVLGGYAEVIVAPVRLCADHTYGDVVPTGALTGPGAGQQWLGLCIAAVGGSTLALAVIWAGRRGRTRETVASGFAASAMISYALAGQWVIPLSVLLAERLMCWPTVWMVWCAAATAHALSARRAGAPPLALVSALGLLVAVYGLRSHARAMDWESPRTLHQSAVDQCPATVHTRIGLGAVLAGEGDHAGALWHFAVAGRVRMMYPDPVSNLPAFEAEQLGLPTEERLANLEQLVALQSPEQWPRYVEGIGRFLEQEGWGGALEVYLQQVKGWGLVGTDDSTEHASP